MLQIVSNLLDNAFAWTPDGGRIDLGLSATNGTISISVADSGPGIGPEERERIFRPFWSRAGEGTGLGLPIARELAQALGGELMLESQLGKGSRFGCAYRVQGARRRGSCAGGWGRRRGALGALVQSARLVERALSGRGASRRHASPT